MTALKLITKLKNNIIQAYTIIDNKLTKWLTQYINEKRLIKLLKLLIYLDLSIIILLIIHVLFQIIMLTIFLIK